jgi:hypothetical protein
MEFVSNKFETTRGFPHLRRVANVRPAAGKETQQVMVVPLLKGCAGGSRSAHKRSLYVCA